MTHEEFIEKLREALDREVETGALEERLDEDRKKLVTMAIKNRINGTSIAEATTDAQASEDYTHLTDGLLLARKRAKQAKNDVKWLMTRWETWRTRSSDQRAKQYRERMQHAQAEDQER